MTTIPSPSRQDSRNLDVVKGLADARWLEESRRWATAAQLLQRSARRAEEASKITFEDAKARPQRSHRRPQCTHTTMDRLHGNYVCHLCGRIPTVKWVYVCVQDVPHEPHGHQWTVRDGNASPGDGRSYLDVQAHIAQSLGMSHRVVENIKDGHYTFDQVEMLFQQRSLVLQALIRDATDTDIDVSPDFLDGLYREVQPENMSPPFSTPVYPVQRDAAGTKDNLDGHAAADAKLPADTRSNRVRQIHKPGIKFASVTNLKCNFQACHSCRPFLQDRLYTSFDAVLKSDMPSLMARDYYSLHVLDASVLRNLGLRHNDLSPSALPALGTNAFQYANECDSPDESTSATRTTSSHTSDFLDDLDPDPTSPGPYWSVYADAQQCPRGCRGAEQHRVPQGTQQLWSSDLVQRPCMSYDRSITAFKVSSISLPERICVTPVSEGADILDTRTATCESSSLRRSTPLENNAVSGEEVEVDGGLALTEEAVSARVPDIRDVGN